MNVLTREGTFDSDVRRAINANFASLDFVPGKTFWADVINGVNASNSGAQDQPFRTITRALAACVSGRGDSIRIMPGTYDEALTINKNYVSLIGAVPAQYGWPDIVAPSASVAITNLTGQGLYLGRLRVAAANGQPAMLQTANGYNFDLVRFHGDGSDCLRIAAGNTDPDDSYSASEGTLRGCELAYGATGVRFLNPGPGVGGIGGVGPTQVRILNSWFYEITSEDIIDEDTAGSNDTTWLDGVIRGCDFLDRNKAVYITLTGGGNNTGIISGNFFADDAGLDGTKIAIATGIVFAGNMQAAGVVNGSGF